MFRLLCNHHQAALRHSGGTKVRTLWDPISLTTRYNNILINPLNSELNPICHFLALLGAQHILHVSRIRVNSTKGHFFFTFYRLPVLTIFKHSLKCWSIPHKYSHQHEVKLQPSWTHRRQVDVLPFPGTPCLYHPSCHPLYSRGCQAWYELPVQQSASTSSEDSLKCQATKTWQLHYCDVTLQQMKYG